MAVALELISNRLDVYWLSVSELASIHSSQQKDLKD